MMEAEAQRSLSMRPGRRIDRSNQSKPSKDVEDGPFLQGRATQDLPMRIFFRRGFIRLLLVSGITWTLLILLVVLFHVLSCQSSITSLSERCRKDSKVYVILDTMGLVPKPQHRCLIPLADDPDFVVIPKRGTLNTIPEKISYFSVDEVPNTESQSFPLFGGHQSWAQREESFKLNKTMKVHCGFMQNGGAEMDAIDVEYAKKCRFVVASGIFDGYDIPHQPSNISRRSRKLFCFLMVVDETSLSFIKQNISVKEDKDGGKWVGIWRLVTLHHPPYDEPRRNGKVPKILTHRLYPQAQYSIWIDGKMELIVDPLLILERSHLECTKNQQYIFCDNNNFITVGGAGPDFKRSILYSCRYLWRDKNAFAIACHKHQKSIYEEADAIKRRKRYARPLIDLHMKIYRYEGMDMWSPAKNTISDVPEGAVIIREHTPLNNLFSCLWFNEVNLFTPRDQLSFGYVVYRLGESFKFFMFPNCEYNSLFILHNHTREHSSIVEWVKSLDELKDKNSSLRESRGGLGLWTPYPGNLSSVQLPNVTRTSLAG